MKYELYGRALIPHCDMMCAGRSGVSAMMVGLEILVVLAFIVISAGLNSRANR
jgi:hypothetical protein